jgi:predicted secreted protein
MDGTAIEQIVDIPLPDGKTGTIDLTNQDSGWTTEKIAARFDANEISLKGIYAGLPGQIALKAAFGDNKRHTFQVTLPDGTKATFLATVGSFSIANEKDAEAFTVNLIVFGKASYSTIAASLTTFSVGTGGTLIPAATLTDGQFTVIVANSTATVALTCADTTVGSAIYVNGILIDGVIKTFPQTITTPVGITNVTVRVTEPNKADAHYTIAFSRLS